MHRYSPEIEAIMREFYTSLNEKERRRYAGLEALKLGRGGQHYIAQVLGCSRRTVRKGACEVSGLTNQAVVEQIGIFPPGTERPDSQSRRWTETLLGNPSGVGRTVYERVAQSYRRGPNE